MRQNWRVHKVGISVFAGGCLLIVAVLVWPTPATVVESEGYPAETPSRVDREAVDRAITALSSPSTEASPAARPPEGEASRPVLQSGPTAPLPSLPPEFYAIRKAPSPESRSPNVKLGDEQLNSLLELAISDYNEGKLEASFESLDHVLESYPRHPEANLIVSYIYAARNQIEAAHEAADLAVRGGPDFAPAYKQRALVRAQMLRYEEAIIDMENYVNIAQNPDDISEATVQIGTWRHAFSLQESQ